MRTAHLNGAPGASYIAIAIGRPAAAAIPRDRNVRCAVRTLHALVDMKWGFFPAF